MTADLSTFSFPTTIRFGAGAVDELPDVLARAGVSRPLLVTDVGVSPLPFFAAIVERLDGAGLAPATFDSVVGNPVVAQVTAGVEAYRAHGADAIVGVGGGAALDVAKAIGVMATHDGDLFDYEDEVPGARPIEDRIPYFVAVPTTAGTGSEVGRSAVIADDAHIKRIVFSPHLLAKVVLADPALTVGLPPHITAATGLDALTHNIEAYLARHYHPICDGIALEGLRLGAANLARAVAEPTDLDARGAMLLSSMMGAIAFQKGLGLVHSCAHALGTAVDMHHGLANGVMIDHALAFNVEVVPERFATMAVTVGLDDTSPTGFLQWLAELKATVGVPAGLEAAGVGGDRVGELAALAIADACWPNGPRDCTEADFVAIFERAL
ncbi:MAG: iron-containing alcohol dehydrogenase [Acidimicrobiales bacterium]|nr:iron-containing alcohol dehydrogenase [Acidimicrobiales bacterium]